MMRHQGFFITGTDTNVGKTFVGSRLVAYFEHSGVKTAPRKPVESGCLTINNERFPADANAYFVACGQREPLPLICPLRFEAALAPPAAARREASRLRLEQLQQGCNNAPKDALLVVEGAGGFYSPISEDGLNADLAEELGLPVLLVAEDRLGCLNHILMTLALIKQRNLHTVAIVLNRIKPEAAEMENAYWLGELSPTPVFLIEAQADQVEGIAALGDYLLSQK